MGIQQKTRSTVPHCWCSDIGPWLFNRRKCPPPSRRQPSTEILLPVGVLLSHSVLRIAKYSRMNTHTHSTREYTIFAPAQLLRNWREQRPSNQDDLDSVSRGRLGESITRGWTSFWFHVFHRTCFYRVVFKVVHLVVGEECNDEAHHYATFSSLMVLPFRSKWRPS
jgi:hypothetical protein